MGAVVLHDPRYQNLAAEAAAGLSAGPNVGRAILAQFAAEKAGEWPPQDNNPGNVHVNAMAAAGVPGLPHGIGDSGACALFATPDAGAAAYATYIAHYPPAAAARAAIAHDDALAYIHAVTAFGYGTNQSAWTGLYLGLGKATLPGATPPPSSPPATYDHGTANAPSDLPGRVAAFLGKTPADNLTKGDIDKLADYAANHTGTPNPFGILNVAFRATFHGALDGSVGHPISGISPDLLGGLVGGVLGTLPAVAVAPAQAAADAAGAAASAALGAVIPFVVGAGVLIVVVMLASGGARDVLA